MKIFYCIFVFIYSCDLINCQVVNRIRLVDHTSYLREVVGKTILEIEERGWCNLKLPEIKQNITEQVFNWDVTGEATYKNGFLYSIENIAINQFSVQQVWLYTAADNRTTVDVRGTLRMQNMALGYDVEARINNEVHYFTGVYTHPVAQFAFSIKRDVFTDEYYVAVTLASLPAVRNLKMNFLPRTEISQILSVQFDNTSMNPGVEAWARDVFTPIAREVVLNKVPFPVVCYNCPVS